MKYDDSLMVNYPVKLNLKDLGIGDKYYDD